MFGDMSGMMNQLQQAQQKIEETKKRLDTVLIDEELQGKVKVTVTANRIIRAIQIDGSVMNDPEELEDYLVLTLNKALARASEINEQEMAVAAKSGMPNIPGMDLFK
ncbi:MAG: YbaB/EbfC family nucleoid-associated protein [Flavobacteriaceae bacterium]|nr:YbaB/EbfC family nucleoid-associated protein [Flavobacteriaceae bacterium]